VPAESEDLRPGALAPATSASMDSSPPRESEWSGPLPAMHLPKGGGAHPRHWREVQCKCRNRLGISHHPHRKPARAAPVLVLN